MTASANEPLGPKSRPGVTSRKIRVRVTEYDPLVEDSTAARVRDSVPAGPQARREYVASEDAYALNRGVQAAPSRFEAAAKAIFTGILYGNRAEEWDLPEFKRQRDMSYNIAQDALGTPIDWEMVARQTGRERAIRAIRAAADK